MLNFEFRSLVFFYFLLLVNPLQAQSTFSNLEPFYINYTTDDGLPSSECHQTIQDQKGYIWIATDNGVSRFDGYGFRNFSADDGLKNNVVFYLQEDHQGKIWMLTMSGNLYYYDYETDRVHEYQHNDKIQEYRDKFDWAGPFHIDSLNTLYLGLKNLGILTLKESEELALIKSDSVSLMIALHLEDDLIYSYVYKNRKTIKNHGKDKKPFYWRFYENNKLEKIIEFEVDKQENLKERLASRLKGESTAMKKLSGGQVLGQHAGKSFLCNQTYEIKERDSFFRTSSEKAILELDKNTLLFGEINPGGIYEFNNLDDFMQNRVKSVFLKGKHISAIQRDREKELWVTTTENGLYYVPNYENKVFDENIGLLSNNISAFTIENSNKLLLGLKNNLIYELNLHEKSLKKLPLYQGSGQIKKIYQDSLNNALWSASGRLGWMNFEKWNYIIKDNATSIDIGKSFNLTADKKYIWSWSSTSFSKINLKSKKIIFDSWDINLRGTFKCVFEDSKGRVWFSNLQGLFELKDSKIISQSAHPAFQNRVEDIDELKDSTLVIGTKGAGVILWKRPEIIQITRKDGLVSDLIENIYIDSLQRIWVGTSEGLNMISVDKERKLTIKKYTQKNGLPSNEINQVEVYGNDVWVATTKGLIKLPEWETDTMATPPFIEKVSVNGEPLINFKNRIVHLKAEQNSLQIEFLTIDYKQHGDIQYRYKLLPSQNEWNYSKNRKLDFSALSDDEYRLEIQSQNRDGYWSKSTVFEFIILPPFWKTWWFVLGIILLVGTTLFFWIKRIRREANLVRKMAEAEQFALRSQMNPHFIFNCLASIQGFVSTGEKDKAIRYLSRFSKLIRTSLLFMDKEKITLEEEITMLTNYLELEKMRHGDKFNYHLKVAEELDVEETEIPPLMVQPFVENSILHAFVDKKDGGLLTVKYQVENNRFKVVIEDNGIGLTESHKRKNQVANNHKSVGTKIIARRLELKKKDTENGLLMTEIKDKNGQVEGTKVIIDFGTINIF